MRPEPSGGWARVVCRCATATPIRPASRLGRSRMRLRLGLLQAGLDLYLNELGSWRPTATEHLLRSGNRDQKSLGPKRAPPKRSIGSVQVLASVGSPERGNTLALVPYPSHQSSRAPRTSTV